jgi:hypothetical protein
MSPVTNPIHSVVPPVGLQPSAVGGNRLSIRLASVLGAANCNRSRSVTTPDVKNHTNCAKSECGMCCESFRRAVAALHTSQDNPYRVGTQVNRAISGRLERGSTRIQISSARARFLANESGTAAAHGLGQPPDLPKASTGKSLLRETSAPSTAWPAGCHGWLVQPCLGLATSRTQEPLPGAPSLTLRAYDSGPPCAGKHPVPQKTWARKCCAGKNRVLEKLGRPLDDSGATRGHPEPRGGVVNREGA